MMDFCKWCKLSKRYVGSVVTNDRHLEPVVLAFGICGICIRKTLTNSKLKNIPIRKAKNPKRYKYLNNPNAKVGL